MEVKLVRSEDADLQPVHAPRFGGVKEEFWWLLCGDSSDNVLAIKRFSFDHKHKATLKLDNFKQGKNDFLLYFMCDSYLGCDQEYAFEVTVGDDADGEPPSAMDED